MPIQTFEFREMIDVLGMQATKAKNWSAGRPFKLEPSIRTATGQGSRNLYSLDDVYLMGIANDLSLSGMSAGAIGELVSALRERFPDGLGKVDMLYVARAANAGYGIELRVDRLPADSIVRLSIHVSRLRREVDQAVRRRRRE
jgi:hypothetical protein